MMIEERDNTNLPLRRYVCGRGIDQPVLMEDAGNLEKYYYHCNALGSAALLTDSAGLVVERYENDTYGNPSVFNPVFGGLNTVSAFGNPYLFTSRHFDNESSLYYYRARHYHPTQGRFLQRDPIGYNDPVGLMNLYSYCGNNGVNNIDPTGTQCLDELKWLEDIGRGFESWLFGEKEKAKEVVKKVVNKAQDLVDIELPNISATMGFSGTLNYFLPPVGGVPVFVKVNGKVVTGKCMDNGKERRYVRRSLSVIAGVYASAVPTFQHNTRIDAPVIENLKECPKTQDTTCQGTINLSARAGLANFGLA